MTDLSNIPEIIDLLGMFGAIGVIIFIFVICLRLITYIPVFLRFRINCKHMLYDLLRFYLQNKK